MFPFPNNSEFDFLNDSLNHQQPYFLTSPLTLLIWLPLNTSSTFLWFQIRPSGLWLMKFGLLMVKNLHKLFRVCGRHHIPTHVWHAWFVFAWSLLNRVIIHVMLARNLWEYFSLIFLVDGWRIDRETHCEDYNNGMSLYNLVSRTFRLLQISSLVWAFYN